MREAACVAKQAAQRAKRKQRGTARKRAWERAGAPTSELESREVVASSSSRLASDSCASSSTCDMTRQSEHERMRG